VCLFLLSVCISGCLCLSPSVGDYQCVSRTKFLTFRRKMTETTVLQCIAHNVQGTSEFMRPAKKRESASHNREKKVHRGRPTEKPGARLSEDVKIIIIRVKDLTGKDGYNG